MSLVDLRSVLQAMEKSNKLSALPNVSTRNLMWQVLSRR